MNSWALGDAFWINSWWFRWMQELEAQVKIHSVELVPSLGSKRKASNNENRTAETNNEFVRMNHSQTLCTEWRVFIFVCFFVSISQLNICQAPLIKSLPISPLNAVPLTSSICWLLLVRSTELLNAELISCRCVKQKNVCLCDFRARVSGPTGRYDDNHAISSTSKIGRTLRWSVHGVLSVECRYRSSCMSMIRTCYWCGWEDDCGLHMNSVNGSICVFVDVRLSSFGVRMVYVSRTSYIPPHSSPSPCAVCVIMKLRTFCNNLTLTMCARTPSPHNAEYLFLGHLNSLVARTWGSGLCSIRLYQRWKKCRCQSKIANT